MFELGLTYHDKGTYITMEGPQFSTRAESILYKKIWNCDVIGMTNMPEAKLAREAEICYASIAMVTDFDCWHPDHESVDVSMIIETLRKNADNAKIMIQHAINDFSDSVMTNDSIQYALDTALITDLKNIKPSTKEKLSMILGRLLSSNED